MAKVIIVSQSFPAYHHKKGQSTFFVEQILNALNIGFKNPNYLALLRLLNRRALDDGRLTADHLRKFQDSLIRNYHGNKKLHTIREGSRFTAGEFFSPRVWSAKPYNSPQIIFAPDTAVQSTFKFQLKGCNYLLKNKRLNLSALTTVARNDGLSCDDLELWFKKPFTGQIICWNKDLYYK